MKRTVVLGLFSVFALSLAAAPVYAATFTTYDDKRSEFDIAISSLVVTELNFDELNDFDEVTDVYADEGVTFGSLGVTGPFIGVSCCYPTALSGAGRLAESNPVSYPIGVGVPWDDKTQSELYVEFASPTSVMGAYFIDNEHAIEVHIFDVNDVEIYTDSISPGGESGDSGEWWGVVADEGVIARMTFTAEDIWDFFAIDNFVFQPVILVDIDIKPGSDPNCFNNDGKGTIPVAILGSALFNATEIDAETVRLESMEIKAVGKNDKLLAHIEDVSGDGFDDLVVQIQDADGIFLPGDSTATLTGNLLDGTLFQGSDTICVVGDPPAAPSTRSRLTTTWGSIKE